MSTLDAILVNPGGRELVYQGLSADLTAVEPPLWCRLIGGYLRDRNFEIDILDTEALNIGPEEAAIKIINRRPRLVIMVVFGHQPSASTQQMVGARLCCQALKAIAPELTILIVGGHISALPERTLCEEPVDYACKGEGPVTAEQLLQALDAEPAGPDEAILEKIPGLVWRRNKGIVINPSAPLFSNLDQDLHGNVWDLLPMERYRAHNWQCFNNLQTRKPYASIYTSLGCPYKCSFCCINAPFDVNRYRMRSPDAVVGEIKCLYETYGIKTFKIIDEMFVLNDRHVAAICNGLAAQDFAPELNIWAYARVDTVKPERLALMRSAGIRWLALGIESGSAHVRDGAEKSFEQKDIIEIVHKIQAMGISVIGNFIFGLPDDNYASMRTTLDLAKEINCEFVNFYSAMAYPGSPLFTMAALNDWDLPAAWSGYSQHSYDCLPLPTAQISSAEVLAFRDDAFHEYFENPRYLDMITQKFGIETRQHIKDMSKHRLKRHILETKKMRDREQFKR
ncbi:MAG: B12-binding domain-containing radical SAM protein [Rhodospirillaceae bacterium]|nr:B12-binding domain-containing radical SAM protein [Rhodospirillaceae bacterium]